MSGRVLIIVGIVLLLLGVLGFVVFTRLGNGPAPADPGDTEVTTNNNPFSGGAQSGPTDTPIPTPTPITLVNIVIAVQELPRGFRIPANAVTIRPWPEESVPFNAVLEVENVVNKIARTDIFREQPILSNMLVDDFENLANDLARVGSDAAAILPDTLVAIAMPVDRITSVAYAVQDGDRVDVIVSMLFVDVDEAFQSIEPSNLTLFTENEDGGIDLLSGVAGRPDTINIGSGGVIISPSEPQRPRLLTQRTIQDALVVKTGEFPIDGRFIGIPPTPTPVPVEDDEEAEEDGPPPPTPVPPRPDILTLGLTPQDAVLLVWAIEARLPLTLALRSATDTRRVPTEPVTLDYFMSEYRITVPAKRDYSIEPAIRSIRQLDLTSSRIEIGAAAPAAAE